MLWSKKHQTLSHTKTLKKHRKSMTRPAGMNVKTQDIGSQLVRFSKSVPSTLAFVMRYSIEAGKTFRLASKGVNFGSPGSIENVDG